MRIGLVLNNTLDLKDQLQTIVKAEEDGFDYCWSLHFLQVGYDALTLLALAGQLTKRIRLGTSVIPVYPYHPQAFAGKALTTQVACGGRLTLGLGVTHQGVVENILGLSYDRPARHLREFLSVLFPLIQQGEVNFKGEVFQVNGKLHVPGSSPFPVMIAALAPAMLRLAGKMTDGTITWMAGPKTLETHIIPRIQEAAAAAEHPQPRVCAALPIAVTDDVKDTKSRAAQLFHNYGQMPNYRRLLDIEDATGPEDVVIIGDEAQVKEQLHALAHMGVTDFAAFIFPATDDASTSTARTWNLLRSLVGTMNYKTT